MLLKTLLMLTISLGSILEGDETLHLQKIKSHTDFKLLLPGEMQTENWKVEVRWAFTKGSGPYRDVRLHYFDQRGEYVLGIEQHKARDYVYEIKIEEIDLQKHTSRTRTKTEIFQQRTNGEVIPINGAKAYFEAWVNQSPGGILHWIQGDTYVEMNSGELTKEQMVEVARSMN